MGMKKLTAALCAAVMMGTSVPASVIPLTVCAVETADATSGTCGLELTWSYNTEDGTVKLALEIPIA